MRMTVPLPNSRSICVSAPCRAASRALAAFSWSVTGMVLLLRFEMDRSKARGRFGRNSCSYWGCF